MGDPTGETHKCTFGDHRANIVSVPESERSSQARSSLRGYVTFRYHVAIEELQDWAYTGNRVVPLKGYPDIVWERPKSRRRPRDFDELELLDRHVPSVRARIVR
jgi:hypothetical protein